MVETNSSGSKVIEVESAAILSPLSIHPHVLYPRQLRRLYVLLMSAMLDPEDREIYSQVAHLFGSSPLSSPVLSSPLRPLHPSEYENTPPAHRYNQYQTVGDVGIPSPLSQIPRLRLPALATVLEADEDSGSAKSASSTGSIADDKENSPELDINALHDVLKYMKSRGVTWGDLVEYMSDPQYKQGSGRY